MIIDSAHISFETASLTLCLSSHGSGRFSAQARSMKICLRQYYTLDNTVLSSDGVTYPGANKWHEWLSSAGYTELKATDITLQRNKLYFQGPLCCWQLGIGHCKQLEASVIVISTSTRRVYSSPQASYSGLGLIIIVFHWVVSVSLFFIHYSAKKYHVVNSYPQPL